MTLVRYDDEVQMERALISIGEHDLKEIIETDGKAELVCHFCNKKYLFSKDELADMVDSIKKCRKKVDSFF